MPVADTSPAVVVTVHSSSFELHVRVWGVSFTLQRKGCSLSIPVCVFYLSERVYATTVHVGSASPILHTRRRNMIVRCYGVLV